jgi:hypothetical protein
VIGVGAAEVIAVLVQVGVYLLGEGDDLTDAILEACKATAAARCDPIQRARLIVEAQRPVGIVA